MMIKGSKVTDHDDEKQSPRIVANDEMFGSFKSDSLGSDLSETFESKHDQTMNDNPTSRSRFMSVFSNIKSNSSSDKSPATAFDKEREWGIFCVENKTDKPIYWGVKGLHLHWKKENSPVILKSKNNPLCDYPPAYYFYNQPKDTKTSSSTLKGHRQFFFSSPHAVDMSDQGLSDWNNIMRYKLEPNTFCLGRFPFHTYSDYFILLVGLYDSEGSVATETETASNSQGNETKQDSLFSRYFGGPKQTFMNYVPRTQTSVEIFEDSNEGNTDQKKDQGKLPNKKKSTFHCKAYFIEHFHNKDVILSATVNKSLFLFSDYSTFTLEPVTYRFFANYRPCENTAIPPIKLSNNIYYDEIREVCIRKGSKKKLSDNSSRNAIQFCGLQMYEDEATNTLRESILFFFLFLRKMDERVNILLMVDQSEIDYANQNLGNYSLMEYLMKFMIGSKTITFNENQKGDVLQWFQSCVRLIGYNTDEDNKDNRYVLHRKNESFGRSFQMYKFSEDCSTPEDFFKTDDDEEVKCKQSNVPSCNIDGVIVLSTVGNTMEKDFKNKLKLLEGFPTLFVLHGLDKCTDIYDAIKRKENAEIEISSIYTNSKPYIIQHKSVLTKSQTDSTELILSQFFRESIDIAVERVTSQHTKNESSSAITSVMKLFSNSDVKIEIKDLQENEQKRNIWFFGLDNEKETVSAAVNSFYTTKCCADSKNKYNKYYQHTNILICVRNREQFMNGKDIIPESRIQSLNNFVVVKRNISDLWSMNNLKRRRSSEGTSTIKKSQSYGALQSLSRKERAKKHQHMRTSFETPPPINLTNPDKSIFNINTEVVEEDSDTDTASTTSTMSNANQPSEVSIHEDSSDGEFDENAIVLVKNESEEEDKKPDEPPSINTALDENEAVKKKKRSLSYPIQKGDIVVLCVELSGRILITGENGLYSTFIQELLNYTDKLVLFVERMDRHEFKETPLKASKSSLLHCNMKASKRGCIYGDEEDLKLDEELCQSQDMKNLKYRCYFSNERTDTHNRIHEFWGNVLGCTRQRSPSSTIL